MIIVAGNIGAGKTTLGRLIAQRLGAELFCEEVDNNPYLEDYYADLEKFAFHVQVFFLGSRLRQHIEASKQKQAIIDRSVYEDRFIFARLLRRRGLMSKRDFGSYISLFKVTAEVLPPPDLMIYLYAPANVLLDRIGQRGRKYEQGITLDYLMDLEQLYISWGASFDLCPVIKLDSSAVDFVNDPAALDNIVARVKALLS
jgi:deoxyadenosine/deoxycytidine kinase